MPNVLLYRPLPVGGRQGNDPPLPVSTRSETRVTVSKRHRKSSHNAGSMNLSCGGSFCEVEHYRPQICSKLPDKMMSKRAATF